MAKPDETPLRWGGKFRIRVVTHENGKRLYYPEQLFAAAYTEWFGLIKRPAHWHSLKFAGKDAAEWGNYESCETVEKKLDEMFAQSVKSERFIT